MMKHLRRSLWTMGVALATTTLSVADIVPPALVSCTVTKVTPEGAKFFGFGPGPTVGDSTRVDLGASEIDGLEFASGAHIGSTVHKHPLKKIPVEWAGLGFYEVSFESVSNGQNYVAHLVAHEHEANAAIAVSLDVVEKERLGRLTLNSIELECVRR